MLKLGLTGGMGSGKSTVASMLAKHGAALLDADAVSRSTTSAGGAAIPLIRSTFGLEFIAPDGTLDREAMRNLVFKDLSAKFHLEDIVHNLVREEFFRRALEFERTGLALAVYDIPLLVESAFWRSEFDRVLVVDCQKSTQVSRVAVRSGLSIAEIERILAAQATRPSRLAAADLVLYNEGISLDELRHEVAEIVAQFGL